MSTVLQAKERKALRFSINKNTERGKCSCGRLWCKLESKSIYLDEIELFKRIKDVGRNGVISLDVDGNTQNVIVQTIK